MIKIEFKNGSITLDSDLNVPDPIKHLLKYDKRIRQYRAYAYHYAELVKTLHTLKIDYIDQAKKFEKNEFKLKKQLIPRDHQIEALNAWITHQARGLVILPTGAGKTFFALMCIEKISRTTLIVVPTIDLMNQWGDLIKIHFGVEPGYYGGGFKSIKDITVMTYDSANLTMDHFGNRFGMMVFDECHHLPGNRYKSIAIESISPFRLGLSATPERYDGEDRILYDYIGPVTYRKEIKDLNQKILSNYSVKKVYIELSKDEKKLYDENRSIYLKFLNNQCINMARKNGWNEFVMKSSRNREGQEAFNAYMNQKKIAKNSKEKIKVLWELIKKHKKSKMIIFTSENDLAYMIGQQFLLPVITHLTPKTERMNYLNHFKTGDYKILVTSRVLNEGIDVPDAEVGIVVSGTGSVREHVQRLGRLLRKKDEKHALLYELVSYGTSEMNVSQRRRNHSAYKRND